MWIFHKKCTNAFVFYADFTVYSTASPPNDMMNGWKDKMLKYEKKCG